MNWSLISSSFLSLVLLLLFREKYERMRIDGISLSSVHIKLADRPTQNKAQSTSQDTAKEAPDVDVPEVLIGTVV